LAYALVSQSVCLLHMQSCHLTNGLISGAWPGLTEAVTALPYQHLMLVHQHVRVVEILCSLACSADNPACRLRCYSCSSCLIWA